MYQDSLKGEMSKLIQSGLIQGKSSKALAKELRKTVNTSVFNSERLMRSELARVQTEAQKLSFKNNGFEEYEFHANSSCCDTCQSFDGKHFKVEKMVIGENAPPLHPQCRCSTSAYEDSKEYDDWLDYLSKGGTTKKWQQLKNSGARFTTSKISGKIEAVASRLPNRFKKYLPNHERRLQIIEEGKALEKPIFADGALGKLGAILEPLPGYYDVVLHGAEYGFEYFGERIDVETLCAIIAQRKDYKKGMKIRLISCNTGKMEDGVAQYIADKLHVEVLAPNEKAILVGRYGRKATVYVGSKVGLQDGEFITFMPKSEGKK